MLQPADRLTLLDALRPPAGMQLDAGVAVTYTLDLRALLAAPAAFALAARPTTDENGEGEPLPAVELLHAIRQHAGRLTVFAQAGQIALPPSRRIFSFLEQTLVSVTPSGGGVVHPKAWVLRYRHPEAGARRLRALITSRNLTFDSSWDLILRLDEDPDGLGGLNGLADLFDGLVGRAAPDEAHRQRVVGLMTDLRAASFALPTGVDELEVFPLGLTDDASSGVLPKRSDRSLIISPFLNDGFFTQVHPSPVQMLVSRADQLQLLGPDSHGQIEQPMTFDDGSDEPADDPTLSRGDPRRELTGLHAKVFAFETDGRAELYVGSPNATSAAFRRNIEVLVRLGGDSDRLGVDRLLRGTGDEPGLESLLRPWQPLPESIPGSGEDPHRRLDAARLTLGALSFTGEAALAVDGTWIATYGTHEAIPDLPELTLHCWPVTQPASRRSIPKGRPLEATFPATIEQLSRLLAIEITDDEGHASAFVVPVDVGGIPDQRDAALLRDLLGNTERFLRYLLALLDGGADDGELLDRFDDPVDYDRHGDANGVAGAFSVPVLERLLAQLRWDPKRLDHIDPLIRDLHEAEALPDGFAELWDALRDAVAVTHA